MGSCSVAHVQRATFLPEWRRFSLQNMPASSLEPLPGLPFLVILLRSRRVRAVLASENGAPTTQPTLRKKQTQGPGLGKDCKVALSSNTSRRVRLVNLRAASQHEITVQVSQTISETSSKTCFQCGRSKVLDDFQRSITSLDERSEACRACTAALRARRAGRPLFHLGMSVEEAWENAKVCRTCGHQKELRDFMRMGDGTAGWCRGCEARGKALKARARAPADTPQVCNECREPKPASEFYPKRNRQNGLSGKCKGCSRRIERARYANLRESDVVLLRPKKVCTTCGEELPRKDFSPTRATLDGLFSKCKICRAAEGRKVYQMAIASNDSRSDVAEQSG